MKFKHGTNITAALARLPRWVLAAIALLLFAAVTTLRFHISHEYSLSLLYLIPVSFAAWFLSAEAGLWMALGSACALVGFDLAHRAEFGSPGIPEWDLATNAAMFLYIIFILDEVRVLYRREQEFSRHDPLTGLLNRRAFMDQLEFEKHRQTRNQLPTTLVYADVDNFKSINDREGHMAGDALLRQAATAMLSGVRRMDVVARLGGDEFGLLLPETDEQAGRAVLVKLQEVLRRALESYHPPVTFSMGAVTYHSLPQSAEQMIEQADLLMYSVKQSGKDRFEQRTVELPTAS